MPIVKEFPTTTSTLRDSLMEVYQTHKDEKCTIDYHYCNLTMTSPFMYIYDLEFIDIMSDKEKVNMNFSIRFKDQEETS
jgi:hypothetical protein